MKTSPRNFIRRSLRASKKGPLLSAGLNTRWKSHPVFRQAFQAVRAAWMVLTTLSLVTILMPYAIGLDRLAQVIPACPTQAQTLGPCVLCGMTRAFYCLAQGHVSAAREFNPLSVWLYLAIVVNAAVLSVHLWAFRVKSLIQIQLCKS